MQRVLVIVVVMLSLGFVGWASSSRESPATEYASVVVHLGGGEFSTQADGISAELNKRAADGWSLVSTSSFAREGTEMPTVLLVFSRPGK